MELNISGTLAILVITWLVVQAIKSTKINNHLLPLLSVVIGIAVAFIISFYTKDTKLVQDIVVGAFTGFGATGVNETITKSITAIFDGFAKTFTSDVSSDAKEAVMSDEGLLDKSEAKEADSHENTPTDTTTVS